MDAQDVLALGLGVTPPWRLIDQRLDTSKQPHVLEILLETERGAAQGQSFPARSVVGRARRTISRNSLGGI